MFLFDVCNSNDDGDDSSSFFRFRLLETDVMLAIDVTLLEISVAVSVVLTMTASFFFTETLSALTEDSSVCTSWEERLDKELEAGRRRVVASPQRFFFAMEARKGGSFFITIV